MTSEEQKELEIRAINTLLQSSFAFEVPLKIEPKAMPKYLAFWNMRFPKLAKAWRDKRLPPDWKVSVLEKEDVEFGGLKPIYVRSLKISPLYLGTIDSMRKLYISIDYDENRLQDNPLIESRRLFEYIDVMAEISAIATLNTGESLLEPYREELNDLTAFYKSHLTSTSLLKLVNIINVMSNQADFTNSIRLTQITGTTKPKADLVE